MTPYLLKKLNDQLKFALGNNPKDEPLYRWTHTRDIFTMLPGRDGEIRPMRKIDEDKWVIEMWTPPQLTVEQWEEAFKGVVPYPRGGEYEVTDIILHPGVEPSEGVTQTVIGTIKAWRHATRSEVKQLVDDRTTYCKKSASDHATDIYRNQLPAFDGIPGKRGYNVSYGGI
jgi:hypothetical protein